MRENSVYDTLGYTPPELRKQKRWIIEYFVKDPVTQKPRRIRHKIWDLQKKNDLRTIQFLCDQILMKLSSGWIPKENERLFKKPVEAKTIVEGIERFMDGPQAKGLRPDSIRSYRTAKNLLVEYLQSTRKEQLFAKDFSRVMAVDLMEYAWEVRTIGNRTYNNYLENFKRFFKYFVSLNYCETNPFDKIQALTTTQKSRSFIKPYDREKISEYLKTRKQFRAIVLLGFWGLVRRTEITRLRIMDIDFPKKMISLEGSKTKNKRFRHITLNDELLGALQDLNLERYPKTHFVFSQDLLPGTKQLCPTRISKEWQNMRNIINIAKTNVFYSLRDTGIVQYIENDVPLNQIAEQAGHKDLKETSIYAIHAKKNPNLAIAKGSTTF